LKPDRVLIAPQSAHARGLEIYLQRKDAGPVAGGLATAGRRCGIRSMRGAVPRSWDQRHGSERGLSRA